jgi:cobalt/nickel transport system ATP-binding protein
MAGNAGLIAAEGLCYAFPNGVSALDQVQLRVHAGERVALIGANGAGKSTLLLALAELLPCRGKVRRAPGCRVSIVFQDPDDQLFMPSVLDEVAFAPLNAGLARPEARKQAMGALERFGLAGLEERHPSALSIGQRKRLCLAIAMAMTPDLLLLDEPFAGLDPAGSRELARWLGGLEVAFVLATHNLELAGSLTERCVVLQGGRVVLECPTAEAIADADRLRDMGL